MNARDENGHESLPLTWREFVVHSVLMMVLLVIAFPSVFLNGELISSADILYAVPPWNVHAPAGFEKPQNPLMLDPLMAFRPDYKLTRDQLAAGQWPLWNPLEYTGVPLMANAQSAVFYPPHLLLSIFDVDTAMTIFVLLKLWLCGATAYLCVRLLGQGICAARFLSAAWMAGSYNLIWACWPLPDVSIWVPVLVLAAEFLLDGTFRRGFVAMSLGATFILFAGHPETAFTMSFGVGLYLVTRLIWERRWGNALWRPLVIAGASWCLALAVYMVQLLPLAEYILHSYTHGERVTGERILNDLEPSASVTFWIARFYGTIAEGTFWDADKVNSNIVSSQHLAVTVWVGLSFALAHIFRKRIPSRSRLVGLFVASAIGILLAYRFPAFELVYRVPVFNSVQPIYYASFATFALPLAATEGLASWLAKRRKLVELWPVLVMIAFVCALVWFVRSWYSSYLNTSSYLDYVDRQITVAAVIAAVVAGVLVVSCLSWRPRAIWTVLTLLLIGDYLFAGRGLNPTMSRDEIFPDTELTRFFEAQPRPCRVGVAEAFIVSGGMSNYGIEEWLGYDGLYPERILRFQKELAYDIWDVMEPVCAIQFYVNDPDQEPVFPLNELLARGALRKVAPCDGLDVYENRRTMPRAFLTGSLDVIPHLEQLSDRMIDPAYDPTATAVTEIAPSGTPPTNPSKEVGHANVIDHTPNRVLVSIDAEEPAVLVLTDAYYPGWKATLDGAPLELFPVYYAFRGAIVPSGQYTVTYEYDPLSLRIGLWVSVLAMVGSSACCIRLLLKKRRSRTGNRDR